MCVCVCHLGLWGPGMDVRAAKSSIYFRAELCYYAGSCCEVVMLWQVHQNTAGPVMIPERRDAKQNSYRGETCSMRTSNWMHDGWLLGCQLIRSGYGSLIRPQSGVERDTLVCLKRSGVAGCWSFVGNHSHSQQKLLQRSWWIIPV